MHGGGYVAGSSATHRPITAALARLTGRRVFSLDYRLAPEHRFPAALDDALAAYLWLLGQGIAPGTLALAGDSAGGGLVLALALRARDEGLCEVHIHIHKMGGTSQASSRAASASWARWAVVA